MMQRISKHTFYFQQFFFQKLYLLLGDAENYGGARQSADGNLIQRRKDAICALDN
jgi:hypothetical protein